MPLRWLPLVVLGLSAAGYLGWRVLSTPEPVAPQDMGLLDPAIRPLLERHLEAAAEEPRSAERHGTLGLIYEANSLWVEARRCFEIASRLDRRDSNWRLHLGVVQRELGEHEEAIALFQEAAEAGGDVPAAKFRLADALLEVGRIDEAIVHFTAARDLSNDRPEGRVGLGKALLRKGDFAGAVQELEAAVRLDRGYKAAHYLLGLAYRELGRITEARRELAVGVESDVRHLPDSRSPLLWSFRVNLSAQIDNASALLRAGKIEEGIRQLEDLRVERPNDTNLINNLAIAYKKTGDLVRAAELLELASSMKPGDFATRINLASTLLDLGELERALAQAEQACALAPEVGTAHMVQAQILVQQQRYSEAFPVLEKTVRLDAGNPRAFLLHGEVATILGVHPEAHASFQTVVDMEPFSLLGHVKLAQACIALGEIEGAEQALAAARRIDPASDSVSELEGRLARLRGER